jgi:hypothetical protein
VKAASEIQIRVSLESTETLNASASARACQNREPSFELPWALSKGPAELKLQGPGCPVPRALGRALQTTSDAAVGNCHVLI